MLTIACAEHDFFHNGDMQGRRVGLARSPRVWKPGVLELAIDCCIPCWLQAALDELLAIGTAFFLFWVNVWPGYEENCASQRHGTFNSVFSFHSVQNEVLLRSVGRIFVMYNIPEGNSVTLTGKMPEDKLGQWPWLTSDNVKRHFTFIFAKNYHVFGLRTSRN